VRCPRVIGNLPGGASFGNYTEGNLTAFFEAAGIRPLDKAPAARPVIALKRQWPQGVTVPAAMTTAAREAVDLSCTLHVQEVDHNPQYPGPTAGMTEADWCSTVLGPMIASLDA